MSALAYRAATAADIDAVVALVESAYRGDASRQGWTTEADFLDGRRTGDSFLRPAMRWRARRNCFWKFYACLFCIRCRSDANGNTFCGIIRIIRTFIF